MKFSIELQNTFKASNLKLLLIKIFGKKKIDYDEYGTEVVIARWFGKDYFINYKKVI